LALTVDGHVSSETAVNKATLHSFP
jgi:hypothetical protein